MALTAGLIDAAVHDAVAMRQAGPDLLGLALMDARNRTLGWLTAFDGLQWQNPIDGFDPPWWLAGRAGWFQEYWIARFVQRAQGEAADPTGARLPSVLTHADTWFGPHGVSPSNTQAQRWMRTPPSAAALQDYLASTLETTLDLLGKADRSDAALHVYRLALAHEDRLGESMAVLVQALDLGPERHQALAERGLWPSLPSRSRRDALWLPGQSVQLGSAPGGWVPEAEKWAHAVSVPEFEIDAQPVTWAQFVEFVDDGGYDQRRWWSDAGWEMLEASGRRAPRYVEQVSGGVLARRQGRLQRLPLAQPVLHISAHEAMAWCQWAGRRLPTEAEWTLAASTASARGFVWCEVQEWVAARAAPYPDDGAAPADPPQAGLPPAGPSQTGLGALDALPPAGASPWRVLRGASAWASPRLRHPQARRYAPAGRDDGFVGFRSCAV